MSPSQHFVCSTALIDVGVVSGNSPWSEDWCTHFRLTDRRHSPKQRFFGRISPGVLRSTRGQPRATRLKDHPRGPPRSCPVCQGRDKRWVSEMWLCVKTAHSFGTSATIYACAPKVEGKRQAHLLLPHLSGPSGFYRSDAPTSRAAPRPRSARAARRAVPIRWHYLSDATCLTRPHLFCTCFVGSRITVLCYMICNF